MSIRTRPATPEYVENWDKNFGKKAEKSEVVEYWECWRDESKRTARFTSLKDAKEHVLLYPRDAEYGIKCPEGDKPWHGTNLWLKVYKDDKGRIHVDTIQR